MERDTAEESTILSQEIVLMGNIGEISVLAMELNYSAMVINMKEVLLFPFIMIRMG